jgi:hypothetical protein
VNDAVGVLLRICDTSWRLLFICRDDRKVTGMNLKMAVFWIVAPCAHGPDDGGSTDL